MPTAAEAPGVGVQEGPKRTGKPASHRSLARSSTSGAGGATGLARWRTRASSTASASAAWTATERRRPPSAAARVAESRARTSQERCCVGEAGSFVRVGEKNLAPGGGSPKGGSPGAKRSGVSSRPPQGCDEARVASNRAAPAEIVQILPAGSAGSSASVGSRGYASDGAPDGGRPRGRIFSGWPSLRPGHLLGFAARLAPFLFGRCGRRRRSRRRGGGAAGGGS